MKTSGSALRKVRSRLDDGALRARARCLLARSGWWVAFRDESGTNPDRVWTEEEPMAAVLGLDELVALLERFGMKVAVDLEDAAADVDLQEIGRILVEEFGTEAGRIQGDLSLRE